MEHGIKGDATRGRNGVVYVTPDRVPRRVAGPETRRRDGQVGGVCGYSAAPISGGIRRLRRTFPRPPARPAISRRRAAAMQPIPALVTACRVDVVRQVARGEDAGNGGARAARFHLHVAAVVKLQLVLGTSSVAGAWPMATKKPAQGIVLRLARLDMPDHHALDAARLLAAHDLLDRVVPDQLDLGVLEQPVLHDLFRAQAVAANAPASPWRRSWSGTAPPPTAVLPPPTTTISCPR